MTAFRTHLARLDAADDRLTVEAADVSPHVLAAEALRADGPALYLPGREGLALASGVYSGPDRTRRRPRSPWSRLAVGLGVDADAPYESLLDAVARLGATADAPAVTYSRRAAGDALEGLHACSFPRPPDATWPTFTLGLAATCVGGETYWEPVHGTVVADETIRARVPTRVARRLDEGDDVSLALGVPAAALCAAYLTAMRPEATAVRSCGVLADVPVIPTAGGLLPSSSELVVEASAAAGRPGSPAVRRECWEHLTESTTLSLSVTNVFAREDPVVPFSPAGLPLSDDLSLTALVAAAALHHRLNNYWGVSPVEWVRLPVEARLGLCVVASEVLYPGFEWQLANGLFAFSSLFDKVVVVDPDTDAADLGRVLADVWVKAHPSRDWIFSGDDAPAAACPRYRTDGETGSRLYVDATWDPRWRQEYVAPRVTFETSFPADVRDAVVSSWDAFGFDPDALSGVVPRSDADADAPDS